ncbi:MAG: hypothetical protein ACXWLR_03910 [Myxococcales bacterium]
MTRPQAFASCVATLAAVVGSARAHMTPPVAIASERDAVARLLSGSSRYFVREVRLSPADKGAVRERTGWSADDPYYRFYVGRGADGVAVGSVVLLTDFTIHGPVRVAVALGPDGKVKGALVAEVTEEVYGWVKPLLDSGFLQLFVGADPRSAAARVPEIANSMQRFYAETIARLVSRAGALYEVAVARSP